MKLLKPRLFSLVFIMLLVLIWNYLSHIEFYRPDFFPYFSDFTLSATHELRSGRFFIDLTASLFRWASGFFLASLVGIPIGLWLGKNQTIRTFCSAYLSLLRSLSPLAWIPFAVIWFGIGDKPVIFLIFLGGVFPLIFSTMNAVFNVPKVYDQLARDYHFSGIEYFFEILFPAVLPQIVSALRLVASLSWVVLVPAEMLAGKEGLGFAILDARNGLRTDLLLFNMLMIAITAHVIDLILQKLNQASQVKWSLEQ